MHHNKTTLRSAYERLCFTEWLSTNSMCLFGEVAPSKMPFNLSIPQLCKDLSSPPSLCPETFCSDYRGFSPSIMSVRLFFFLFSPTFFSPLLPQGTVCHHAEQVLLTGCDVWVRMHDGLAGHFCSLSSGDHSELFCTGVNVSLTLSLLSFSQISKA